MGLRKAELFVRAPASWAFGGAIAVLSLGLQTGGTTVRDALMFDRLRIIDGELYRLATGHLVHLDWRHLLLNLAGLMLVWVLVGDRYRALGWLVIAAVSAATIDGLFWWLIPELRWYVGLSGVLHGLLIAGAIGLIRERRGEALVLLVVVVAKLMYEHLFGPMPVSADTSGSSVITEAHLYGAIGGAIAAVVMLFVSNRQAPAPGGA